MRRLHNLLLNWKMLKTSACIAFLCTIGLPVFSQVQSVNTIQSLSFGAFAQGINGGTVTVSGQGIRSATGTVVLFDLGQQYHQALFDVAAPAGTIITITNGPDATLAGSNGGAMTLSLGISSPASPMSADPSGTTRVSIGATLTVGNESASPPGNYSGTFSITFNNQ